MRSDFGQTDIFSNLIAKTLQKGRTVIDIKSQITPNIHIDVHELLTTPPHPIIKLAKPRIRIKGFGLNINEAPWGEPTKNYIPAVVLCIILSYLLTFYIGTKVG